MYLPKAWALICIGVLSVEVILLLACAAVSLSWGIVERAARAWQAQYGLLAIMTARRSVSKSPGLRSWYVRQAAHLIRYGLPSGDKELDDRIGGVLETLADTLRTEEQPARAETSEI